MTGEIRIHNDVIRAIVGKCCLNVPGIHGLSGGGGSILDLVGWGGDTETKGIEVLQGEDENSQIIEIRIVVEKGQPIPTVAENLQRSVKETVENATGLEVLEVNVRVEAIHDKVSQLTDEPVPEETEIEE